MNRNLAVAPVLLLSISVHYLKKTKCLAVSKASTTILRLPLACRSFSSYILCRPGQGTLLWTLTTTLQNVKICLVLLRKPP